MTNKKKIALLMGRGIEGCGVTKFSLEQLAWLNNHGYAASIYAIVDKYWAQNKAHDISNIHRVRFVKDSDVNSTIAALNEHDLIIINSLPSTEHPKECIDGFKRLLKEVKKPFVLIQHDHSMLSIKRNACIDEAIEASKLLFVHSPTNDFAEYVKENGGSGGLSSFMGEEEKVLLPFQPGLSFDPIRKKYWKDIKEQDVKHHKFIGRTTTWKGYFNMIDFHNDHLRAAGCLTTCEGLSRTPAFMTIKERNIEFEGNTQGGLNRIDTYDLSDKYGKPIQIFSSYSNERMLERMSRVGFGYQLSLFKSPKYIYRSLEYTHCEVVCTGVIPVFRKGYGDLCIHRKHGIPFTQCKNNGTVWLGEKGDTQAAMDLITTLTNDSVMRNEWREQAYEFYRDHQDAEYTFEELTNTIMKEIKL